VRVSFLALDLSPHGEGRFWGRTFRFHCETGKVWNRRVLAVRHDAGQGRQSTRSSRYALLRKRSCRPALGALLDDHLRDLRPLRDHLRRTFRPPAAVPGVDGRRGRPPGATGAGAVAHFQRAMMMDVDQAAKAMKDEEILAEIEDFIEGFNQPTYRGMRINGQRVATWSSRDGWSGDSRPEAEWLQ
jgi:hypothetical protein